MPLPPEIKYCGNQWKHVCLYTDDGKKRNLQPDAYMLCYGYKVKHWLVFRKKCEQNFISK